MVRHYRDYLGVWPDVGNPPRHAPFPLVCRETLTVLAVESPRYLEWVGYWRVPTDPPDPPVRGDSDFTLTEQTWAGLHNSDPLAAWVLHGDASDTGKRGKLWEILGSLQFDWQFPIGERILVVGATCVDVRFMGKGDFGDKYLCEFTDGRHYYSWWTGGGCFMEPGWTGDVKATIKAHTIYGGKKQTVVTRCSDNAVKRARKTQEESDDAA